MLSERLDQWRAVQMLASIEPSRLSSFSSAMFAFRNRFLLFTFVSALLSSVFEVAGIPCSIVRQSTGKLEGEYCVSIAQNHSLKPLQIPNLLGPRLPRCFVNPLTNWGAQILTLHLTILSVLTMRGRHIV